jgi:hypothetical protein
MMAANIVNVRIHNEDDISWGVTPQTPLGSLRSGLRMTSFPFVSQTSCNTAKRLGKKARRQSKVMKARGKRARGARGRGWGVMPQERSISTQKRAKQA